MTLGLKQNKHWEGKGPFSSRAMRERRRAGNSKSSLGKFMTPLLIFLLKHIQAKNEQF
jgi:hypothetical protein